MQGRNNAVLCTIAQMANKREKDLLGFMKKPMVEVISPSKGVGQGSSVVIHEPVLDKEVSVVTAAQKCPARKVHKCLSHKFCMVHHWQLL